MSENVDTWATTLMDATLHNREAPRPSQAIEGFTLDHAYAIQQATIALREASGEQVRAIKLGLTKQPEQEKWDIPHPTFGTLTDRMLIEPGETFSLSRGHAPRIEAEVVVVMASDVTSPPHSLADLLPSIGQAYVGIEILDSRFRDGVSHPFDGVADNQSALSGVWSTEGKPLNQCDLSDLSVTVTINSQEVATGHSAAILGNPLNAVFGVIVDRLKRGVPVPGGLAIFTGNMLSQPLPVSAGDSVLVSCTTLGDIALDIVA
jgi:2-keto-4-pentenoate hydratase